MFFLLWPPLPFPVLVLWLWLHVHHALSYIANDTNIHAPITVAEISIAQRLATSLALSTPRMSDQSTGALLAAFVFERVLSVSASEFAVLA
jgi:hypothetical protein